MCTYTVDTEENKGTVYNSFVTYAVVSLHFGWKGLPWRDTVASKKVCPKLSRLKRILRATSEVKTYNLLIPGFSHTLGLEPQWNLQN